MKLIIATMDFSRDAYSRVILSKILTASDKVTWEGGKMGRRMEGRERRGRREKGGWKEGCMGGRDVGGGRRVGGRKAVWVDGWMDVREGGRERGREERRESG